MDEAEEGAASKKRELLALTKVDELDGETDDEDDEDGGDISAVFASRIEVCLLPTERRSSQ